MIDVYVVTGMRAYQDALAQALEASGRIHVVGSASHPTAALRAVATLDPVVVLLDHPGPVGPAWARDLSSASTSVRVLVMGLTRAEAELGAWAHAGVVGYTGVDATLEDLIRAVERAAFTAKPGPMGVVAATRVRLDLVAGAEDAQRRLTLREHEIMRLVGEGYSNQQIARRLSIALGTVKNHIHNVLEKLDVQTRLEAVNAVRRVGFVRWHEPADDLAIDPGTLRLAVPVAVGSD